MKNNQISEPETLEIPGLVAPPPVHLIMDAHTQLMLCSALVIVLCLRIGGAGVYVSLYAVSEQTWLFCIMF